VLLTFIAPLLCFPISTSKLDTFAADYLYKLAKGTVSDLLGVNELVYELSLVGYQASLAAMTLSKGYTPAEFIYE